MNKVNYQKQLEDILRRLPEENSGCHDPQAVPVTGKKKLLIHSCCAPCSSYVLEYLRDFFDITVLYYNPNITDRQEYEKRTAEQKRLIEEMNSEAPSFITMETGRYEPEVFFAAVKGLEQIPEGGERWFCCYEIRLRETARLAGEKGFDYFTTTLTISPLKNADKLNEIGEKLGAQYGVPFLLISKRRMAINVLWNFLKNMVCTARITAAAFFPKMSGTGGTVRSEVC